MLFSLDTRVVIVPAARYGSGTKFEKFKSLESLESSVGRMKGYHE
jgi:hypothetical protein